MTAALRPMSTGEVLDRTFNLYRNNFQLFAGIATVLSLVNLVGALVVMLLTQGVSPGSPAGSPSALGEQVLIWAFGYIFFLLIGFALSLGATIYAVSEVHLGKPTTIKECYRRIRPQVWSLINIVISTFCRAFGAFCLIYFASAIFAFAVGRTFLASGFIVVVLACGFVAGTVCGIAVICKYAFAVPTRLLENLKSNRFFPLTWRVPVLALVGALLGTVPNVSVLAGVIVGAVGGLAWVLMVMPKPILQRSNQLSKGSRFRIFIVLLLVMVLYFGFAWGMQYGGAQVLSGIPYAVMAWSLLGGFIASTLAFPIVTIAFSLFYYDERIRKEAFDLQLMMEAVGQVPPAQSVAAAAPSIG